MQLRSERELTDGFHLVIDALKLNGIDTIYGVPGIPITDFGRMAQAAGIRVLSFRHEQNAGYAASIAGFLTKKPGVCLTVSAPGFLNGLTALAHATTNCFPMILISGSSEREVVDLQQGDYEEMDQLADRQTALQGGVPRTARARHRHRRGARDTRCRLGASGRRLSRSAGQAVPPGDGRGGRQRSRSSRSSIQRRPSFRRRTAVKRALDVLRSAKRPLIILGKGAAYAQADDAIRALVEKSGAPFLPMSMAKGLLARHASAVRGRGALDGAEGLRRRDADRRAPQLAAVARQGQDVG